MSDKWTFFVKHYYKVALPWLLLVLLIVAVVMAIKAKAPQPIYVKKNTLSSTQLSELYGVTQSLGEKQFYNADLGEILQQVSQISWVDNTKVYRDWQRGVVVSVVPRVAVANFGSEYLLDASGVPFSPADKRELNNPKFTRLYGDHAYAKEIMRKMQKLNEWFAPLHMSVADIVLTPRQTWLIKFDNGLRVTVDYDRVDEKLLKLSDILKQGELPVNLADVATIDLRYKNGFSISKKLS